MSTGPLLLPNLGGEEGGDWRRQLREPRVAAAARLWRLLFDDSARVADGGAPAVPWDRWPDAFAEARTHPAFAFLDELRGCVPWWADRRARSDPAAQGLPFPGPPAEVIEAVHDKAFALACAEAEGLVPRELRDLACRYEADELRDTDRFVSDLRRRVDAWPAWTRGRFTLKPRFGTSGRGRFDARDGDFDETLLRRASAALAARGGAVLEPWLDRRDDLSVQLRVEVGQPVTVLGSLRLEATAGGGYQGHRGEVDARGRVFSGHAQDEDLRVAAVQVAVAAAAVGFHGVAGVDALTFRIEPDEGAGDRRAVLRPVVEVNARFTMGTVVVGLVRRCLPAVRSALGLAPGTRCGFVFRLDAPPGGWDAALRATQPSLLVRLGEDGDDVQPGLLFAARAESLEPGDAGARALGDAA